MAETRVRNGVVESVTTASVQTPRVFAYDALGRKTAERDPRTGYQTTYTYDPVFVDQVATETLSVPAGADPATGQSRTVAQGYYPATQKNAGKPASRTENQATTYYAYTDRGELARTWGATAPVRYEYDDAGRLKELQTYREEPGANPWAWPVGDRTISAYHPGTAALASKTDAAGKAVSYTYDEFGRLDVRTWARGETTNFDHDWQGQLVRIDYQDAGTPDVVWSQPDARGRYRQLTDGAGAHTLDYDLRGALKEDTVAAGGLLGGMGVSATIGALGRVEGWSASVGGTPRVSQSYGYDAVTGRLASAADALHAVSASYGHAPGSDLIETVTTKLSGQTRLTAISTWDGLNRLHSLSQATPLGATVGSHTYDYNAKGERRRETQADGQRWNYLYDDRGEVIGGERQLTDGRPVPGASFGYDFDPIGNRRTATVNGRAASYARNLLNQYDSREVPGAFDALGEAGPGVQVRVNGTLTQRLDARYYRAVPVANQGAPSWAGVQVEGFLPGGGPPNADRTGTVPAAGAAQHVFVAKTPEQFSHDDDGNLTGDGRWIYTWDGENRLVKVETQPAAIAAGAPKQKLEFAYDGRSRRIQTKVFAWSGGAWVLSREERYLYDLEWNVLAILDGSLAVQRTFLWGTDLSGTLTGAGGVGGLLAMNDVPTNTRSGYLYDGNGNVRELVDLNTQAINARYEYGPFGESLRATGAMAKANPFHFSTKYTDEETKLLYYGYRFYGPNTGRWLNKDPLEEQDGKNLYVFLSNNGINANDFLGLAANWHHLLPQAKEFASWFSAAGITDINAAEYGWIMNVDDHITGENKIDPKWNVQWKQYKDLHPTATKKMILSQMEKMRRFITFAVKKDGCGSLRVSVGEDAKPTPKTL